MQMMLKIAALASMLGLANPSQALTTYAGNAHQYAFVATSLSWQDALAAAAAATPIAGYDAHLVTITSAGEDAFVKALTGSALYVWAAGTDAALEGTWKWAAGPETGQTYFVNGGPVVGYSNWNAGEPNNSRTENFLHFKANVGDWNDIYPTFPAGGYVVEYSLAVPEPGSWALLIAGFGLTGTALRRNRRACA